MNRWFRWYEGTCDDGKFRLVKTKANNTLRNAGNASNGVTENRVTLRDVISVWAVTLEGASSWDSGGKVRFDSEYIAAVLDFCGDEPAHIMAAFEETGLLVRDGEQDDQLFVTSWNKRQYLKPKTDNTRNERQRRFREKQKNESGNASNGVTERYVTPETPPEAESETDTDTDINSIDTDPPLPLVKEPKSKSKKANPTPKEAPEKFDPTTMPIPDWLPLQSWMDWCQHRINIKNPLTQLSANGVIRKLKKALDVGMSPADLILDAVTVGKHPMPVYDNQIESFTQLRHKPTKPAPPPGVEPPPYETIVVLYNEICSHLIPIEVIEGRNELKEQIEDHWYRPIKRTSGKPILGPDLDKWRALFTYIAGKCRRLEKPTESGWIANLSWILTPEKLMKISEGEYEGNSNV